MASVDLSKATACERCHRRKTRCDKVQPTCSPCARTGLTCLYGSRGPTLRRGDVESLERRVRHLDAQNKALTRSLHEARRHTSAADTSAASDGSRASPSIPQAAPDIQYRTIESEVANEVSSLSLHAGGDRDFLGSASGILLGRLLQIEVRTINQARGDETPQTSTRPLATARSDESGIATPELTSLPSEKLARSLLLAYLSHDHLCYPFLHPRSLMEALDAIYDDDTFYRKHPVEAFVFDMVLAIGTAQVYKYDWQVLPDAGTHHERALSRLVLVLGKGGTVALQAILLLCQYRMLSALYETSASLWHLVGMAARMCFELGMHRESTYRVVQSVETGDVRDLDEASEIKRRCFWSIFALDRIASITLGRPLAIQLEDCDTELPEVRQLEAKPPNTPLSYNVTFDSPQWQSRTAIFVHIITYRTICGKILTSLHNTTRSKIESGYDYATVGEGLRQELETWYQNIDNLRLVDSATLGGQDRSSFRSRDWYHMLFHNGILMLYRPSSTFQDSLQTSPILLRIFESAQQSIAAYAYLHGTRKINYSWVTLHAVFIAGLSYIYAVRSHFQTRRAHSRWGTNQLGANTGVHLPSDPSVMTIVNDTRACSTILVAVSERWPSARNCHVVFGRLSDAVLADVVDFHTKSNQLPQISSLQQSHNANFTGSTSATSPNTGAKDDPFGFNTDIATTYQDCFNDVNQLYNDNYYNEAAMQVSQDWLFQIQALNEIL